MKLETIIMKARFSLLLAACALVVMPAFATPPVSELFLCNLNPGKTMSDLDATVASWQKSLGVDKAFDRYQASILTPLRANTPYDLIWIGSYPDLNATAEAMATIGPRSEAHFADVVTCESGLTFADTVYENMPDEPNDDDAIVEVYSCVMKEGKTLADLKTPHEAYVKAMDVLGKTDPALSAFNMYTLTPYLANTPADIVYLSVSDDIRAMAKANSAYLDSPEGQAAEAAWNAVGNCESGVWNGKWVLRRRVE
jgi:hypothetical protein